MQHGRRSAPDHVCLAARQYDSAQGWLGIQLAPDLADPRARVGRLDAEAELEGPSGKLCGRDQRSQRPQIRALETDLRLDPLVIGARAQAAIRNQHRVGAVDLDMEAVGGGRPRVSLARARLDLDPQRGIAPASV